MAGADLERVLDLLRRRESAPPSSIEEARARLETFATVIEPVAGVRLTPARLAAVPCEWVVAPGAVEDGALLYLHGGGYGLGSLATHRALVSRLSATTGLPGLTVGYRLAPEHPFPAAVDDAVAVYRALLERGVPPARIVVAGDSAGGGLAMATALAVREAAAPLPAAVVCLSPWVDLDVAARSDASSARDPMVAPDELFLMAALYLAGADPRAPLASPLHGELHGLPPLLIHVGSAETLLEDSLRLAARVRDAGGTVTLEQWADMIHVWHAFAPLLPEAEAAIARIGAWVRERIAPLAMRVPGAAAVASAD
jgi:acetyl esterase/lipase